MKDNKDVDSLSHTTWRCQYHVVFAPKYRRMVIYGQIKKDIGQILRQEYIKNQLQQDQIADQLSLKEFVDPFKGLCWYYALLGLTQATGSAGVFDESRIQ